MQDGILAALAERIATHPVVMLLEHVGDQPGTWRHVDTGFDFTCLLHDGNVARWVLGRDPARQYPSLSEALAKILRYCYEQLCVLSGLSFGESPEPFPDILSLNARIAKRFSSAIVRPLPMYPRWCDTEHGVVYDYDWHHNAWSVAAPAPGFILNNVCHMRYFNLCWLTASLIWGYDTPGRLLAVQAMPRGAFMEHRFTVSTEPARPTKLLKKVWSLGRSELLAVSSPTIPSSPLSPPLSVDVSDRIATLEREMAEQRRVIADLRAALDRSHEMDRQSVYF
jgi:hypothetical protein